MQMVKMRGIHTSIPRLKTIPKNLKGKSGSSQEWLTRHLNDPYVKKAQELNYRARSAFKILEIDDKLKILKPGQICVECGAAPGAWTQIIVKRINSDAKNVKKPTGKIIGIDLLPISPLDGAIFLPNSDFTSESTQSKILQLLKPETIDKGFVDVILSDMAPNATGHGGTDHTRIINLSRKVLEFALKNGKVGSHFLTKLWDGNETKGFMEEVSRFYGKVLKIKPPSSRSDSSELFVFGGGKKS